MSPTLSSASSDLAHESSEALDKAFLNLSAAEAADYFLSPFCHKALMNFITRESGPAMWVVNRSDVYDATLEKLRDHSLPDIANRAAEKLRARHSSLSLLEPPVLEHAVEETPDYEVEDVLGHPLCSFEAMLFFSKSLNLDHRASSALSLTRRLVEHPPNWSQNLELKNFVSDRFAQLLLEDTSEYVRAYAARVPLFSESVIENAFAKESHPFVRARLLQNPATSLKTLDLACESLVHDPQATLARSVLALDERLNPDQRRHLKNQISEGEISSHIHSWILSRS